MILMTKEKYEIINLLTVAKDASRKTRVMYGRGEINPKAELDALINKEEHISKMIKKLSEF